MVIFMYKGEGEERGVCTTVFTKVLSTCKPQTGFAERHPLLELRKDTGLQVLYEITEPQNIKGWKGP